MATMASFHICPRCGSQEYQQEERRGDFRRECAACGHFHEYAYYLSEAIDRATWRPTTDGGWERIGQLRKRGEDQGIWVVMDTWFRVPTTLHDDAVQWDTGTSSGPQAVENSDRPTPVVTREGIEAAVAEVLGGSNRAVVWIR